MSMTLKTTKNVSWAQRSLQNHHQTFHDRCPEKIGPLPKKSDHWFIRTCPENMGLASTWVMLFYGTTAHRSSTSPIMGMQRKYLSGHSERPSALKHGSATRYTTNMQPHVNLPLVTASGIAGSMPLHVWWVFALLQKTKCPWPFVNRILTSLQNRVGIFVKTFRVEMSVCC